MAYQIKVSKEAERELSIAKCYYKISNLEEHFDSDFKKQIKYLEANPFLFRFYYRNVRLVHFDDFKYSIHFIIKNKVVYILKILHHKQEYK
ncbi:type II toxin-antitoxin system RelE/ParE family toxin [Aureibaculum luteum]|uniref:type II toxin-antitoxin system RelE/ParE family toxin n=1 Tax=Aureibaculum luteum TaxID=1548456 RepID=UPI000E535AA1|nr:type II toxin-antitoxin system RelE/ParE family toxin [Aureibaculum luteum]